MSPASETLQSAGWVSHSLDGYRNSPAVPSTHRASISSFDQVQSGEGSWPAYGATAPGGKVGRSDERSGGGLAAGSLGRCTSQADRVKTRSRAGEAQEDFFLAVSSQQHVRGLFTGFEW